MSSVLPPSNHFEWLWCDDHDKINDTKPRMTRLEFLASFINHSNAALCRLRAGQTATNQLVISTLAVLHKDPMPAEGLLMEERELG
jgi:hypothetical protein